MTYMKKKYLLIISLSIIFKLTGYSQNYGYCTNNLLLPDRLIVGSLVPFDSSYIQPIINGLLDKNSHPYFHFLPQIDIPETLAKKAIGNQVTVYDADQVPDLGPFSGLTPIDSSDIRLKLGGKTEIVMVMEENNYVEKTYQREINFNELVSAYTIEEWALTINPLHFDKKVNAVIPVRRYNSGEIEDDDRFYKTFCFLNPVAYGSNNMRQIAAKVEYEYIFNQPQSFMDQDFFGMMKNELNGNELLFDLAYGSYNSPYFNNINQRNFIETMLNQVFEGKANSYDYQTNQLLTFEEAKKRVYINQTIMVINEFGEAVETTYEQNISEEICSVIFIEDWYIDPQTMQMEKKVTGIAPVIYSFDTESGEFDLIKREILFKVELSN
jgi:hypothetical protein